MKVVIKIGGTLLEDDADRRRMTALVARQVRAGHPILLVHGGGKQLTAYLEKTGIVSEFVNGLRVTSAETLDGVLKVFAGTVNHRLLAAFHAQGIPAAGISGIDDGCLLAEKLRGERGEDWGYVGRITRVNPRLWEALLAAGMLPVLACLAVGEDGQIYNVNADQAAVSCAIRWRAQRLIFLTDVDGVRDTQARILPQLAADELRALLRSGAVTGGMLAKLNAVEQALAEGVPQIHIRNGHRDAALDQAVLGEEEFAGDSPAGTVIVSSLPVGKKK